LILQQQDPDEVWIPSFSKVLKEMEETDNHKASLKPIYSYVSIHPFCISPMDDIVAAHLHK
jgi:hypothetical protein